MAIPLRRTHATFISLEPTDTNTNLTPAAAQATSSAAPSVPATRPPIPLRRTHATFIPLEPVSTNTSLPPPPPQPTSSTALSVPTTRPPVPLRRTHATFISLEPTPTNTNLTPAPAQATSSAAPSVPATRPPVPLRRTHATFIPLEPASTNTSLPPPPTQPTSSTALSVPTTRPPVPLRRTHATLISLAPPESTSASLPPPPTQATPSTTPIIPAAVPTPTPSASTSTPVAELPFPLPLPDVLYACNYACGPKLCNWCAKDRPPVGHKDPIPHFIVSTIIRHAMPHRFEPLEQIKEREFATGLVDPPNLGERDGDDVEYQPGGDFKPPAWGSDQARPKKSSVRKSDSPRFAPYPDPSTRNALVRRSTEDIKASLDEALANRMQLNYEGPVAIAIRNEISAIHIPGEEPFKWEPEYTGPPSEAFPDGDNLTSVTTANAEPSATELTSSIEEDLEDEAAVVEIVLPTRSKKRRYAEDDDDATINSTTDGSPTKKPRTTRKLPGSKFPTFTIPSFKFPSFSFPNIASFSSFTTPSSPLCSTSPSAASTAVATDSSSSDGESSQANSDLDSSSPRKARIAKKKLRFVFSDPSSTHPKFGTRDSIYWHHRRLTSTSKNVRNQKKHKEYVPQGETWSPDEVEHASMGKADWDLMRQASLVMKTSRKSLEERVKKSEAIDASSERFQKLVDRYEAKSPAIDLAAVRARYIRPEQNEVLREKNKEAMPLLGQADAMRKHYPAWEHPAWDEVDRNAIAEWRRSPHYKLKVHNLAAMVETEEKQRKRANAEPDEATEIATVADEDEERMRREYLAAEVDEVEAPSGGGSGSAWGAPAPGEGEGGLHRQMAMSAVDFEDQWSAPAAHLPTGFDVGWSTPGAGPSTWASSF